MKKKVGIITINDFNNFGNRLQNYAMQEILRKLGFDVVTIKNDVPTNNRKRFLYRKIKNGIKLKLHKTYVNDNFKRFNELIIFSEKTLNPYNANKFPVEYFIVGSDQVWNPELGRLSDVDLLNFTTKEKKIAYACSFGINNLDKRSKEKVYKNMSVENFKNISVREEQGKHIIENITNRNDIKVVLDPTMLLEKKDWIRVEKKPSNHDDKKKYILTYFLGENPYQYQLNELNNKYNYTIINLKDKNCADYYSMGPSEFLYLFHHAEAIFTDSFHACVFAVIYNRPFYVFKRKQQGLTDMSSRLDTFLKTFNLENRKIEKIVTIEAINNYEEVVKILESKRKESIDYLHNALKK